MGPAGRLVTIKRSGGDGAHFPLSLSTCLFGRGAECDIRIQLPVVSRQHCKIEVKERKAVLFNFSSANPTQVNGSAIDGPVQLRHGDVITVIDRSFRYEDDRHQSGSASTEFPGQRHGQATPRRVSGSGSSSHADGEAEGRGAAGSQLTEEGVSGEPPARTEGVRTARAGPRSSGGPAARSPPDGRRSEPLRDSSRSTAGSLAGVPGEGPRGALVSRNGGPEALASPRCPEKGGEKESPFRKLYESMKEKLDVKSEKENVLQDCRKSGSQGGCAADSEGAGGSRGQTPLQGPPRPRRRSRRGSQTQAGPAPEERTGEGPSPTLEATASPSVPPVEAPRGSTPVQCSHQSSPPERRSGGQGGVHGSAPVTPAPSAACAPEGLLPGHGAPPGGERADGSRNTPEKVFSRKRRSGLPPKADILATETETPKPVALAPQQVHVEKEVPGGSLGPPRLLGATAGRPGLSPTDVGDLDESLHETEGVPLKMRRVSFGGRLRPELFDENLPPNTPLKRGETPVKRRSLVTPAPAALKKIIKGRPRESGKGDAPEIRLEVTAQNVSMSSPAGRPTKSSSLANESRRRSSKLPASSGSQPPAQTDVPKRGGRRSSGAPSRRASAERGRHGVLRLIQARRRSGASGANLMVARSWADVVKLSAKQTQAQAVRHGPPRQPSRRRRKAHTPKKPAGRVYSEFSTGHANSPCTIVIGRAHVEKVPAPARPCRMLNHSALNRKIDFSEDLSGLTEMFQTPAKEKPRRMSLRLTAFSHSGGLFGNQFPVPECGEKPRLCAPAESGENVFPGAQKAPEGPSDEKSASPALGRRRVAVNDNVKTPLSGTEPAKTAPSVNEPQGPVGLRDTQGPGAGSGKEDPELDAVESILGRCLRKLPGQAQLGEGERKGSERALATCEGNFGSEENSEKKTVMRRSRRSSELECAPRTDVISVKPLQETEAKEDLAGIHRFLRTPGHAGAPGAVENRAAGGRCGSPPPEPGSAPSKTDVRIGTPSQSMSADALCVLGKPTGTPGDATPTHKAPGGGDESMKASKKTLEQQQDSADHVIGSRRRPRTPKKKPQPIEDLSGFQELFQTPKLAMEAVTDDKTMKIPSKSPKPEPGSTPTSTRRCLGTPLGRRDLEEELSALGESTPAPGETAGSAGESQGADEDIRASKGTLEQKRDSAKHVSGRRESRTPRRKVEPTEDLTGFQALFQTPNHTDEPMTENKTMKIPSKSPKPEPGSTKRRPGTPLGRGDLEEELSGPRKPTQTSGEITRWPRDPEGDDEHIRASKGTPEQKLHSAEHVTESRRRPRTPRRKLEPTEDLTGFQELFQTPSHLFETVTISKTTKVPGKSPKPEPVSAPSKIDVGKVRIGTPSQRVSADTLSILGKPTWTPGDATPTHKEPGGGGENMKASKKTPEQKLDSAEHVSRTRRRSRTPRRKVEPTEDLTGFQALFQTPNHTDEPMTENKTMKIPSKSPKPEPGSTKRRPGTPLGRGDLEEELSGPRKPTQTSGEITRWPRDPEGDDEHIRALKGTPEQKLHSAEHVSGSRKRPRTPKKKPQPIEDLSGFQELFQTPKLAMEAVTDDKTMKIPSKSPKPEPGSTPTSTRRRLGTPLGRGDLEEELSALGESTPAPGETAGSAGESQGADEDIRASKGTLEQKRDSAKHVSGRRESRTPRRKVELTEDLTGFQALFQTPNHTDEPMTENKTMKIPSKSPKPEPGSTKRRPRTPLGRVDLEEELSGPRKPTQTSGEITRWPRDPEGDDEDIRALKGTPEQKLHSADHVSGSRRRPRTPKKKPQSIEDLSGFQELFQTPKLAMEAVTDKTMKIPSKSPKPEPGSTPSSTRRRPGTPLGRGDPEEELSALGESTPAPGETTRSAGEPEGADEDIRASKGTPEQKWDLARPVSGSRRRESRTPRRKVEPTEDLAGFQALFQTPNHTDEPMTEDKTMKKPSKSPKPEPGSTPTSTKRCPGTPLGRGDLEEELSALRESTPAPGETAGSAGESQGADEDIRASKGTLEQKRDSAKHVSGRRESRTPRRKVELTEDLTGFQALFQTPNHTDEPMTENKTMKIPSKSPKPEPGSTKRRPGTPLGRGDLEEELSGPRKPTQTSGEITRWPRDPEGDDEHIRASKGTPEQKLHSAEHVTGSRRRPRTPRRKFEPIEDLTGFQELFQTPNHIVEPMTEDKTMKIPSKSPKPEPGSTPTSTRRRLGTPLGRGDLEEELSALGESTPALGETARSAGELEGADKDSRASKGTPEQKQDLARLVSGRRRRSRTPTRVNQPIEDLTGFKELFQTPRHTVEPMIEDKATEMPCKSAQAKPAVMPTGRNRRLKAPAGNGAVGDKLSIFWSPTRPSRRTTRSHREPEWADKDMKLSKESPEQKLLPAENVAAGKRRPGTRKEKAQFPADPASPRELLQIPSHTKDPVAVASSTEMPSRSPQAEAVMPARTRRQLKAPPVAGTVQGEPSALRRPRGTSGKATRSHRAQEGADEDMKLSKESPEQTLDPAESVAASKRRPRTRKEKAQIPADPASPRELLQIPGHTEDPVAVASSTEMPSRSPQAEAVMPARTRRQLKAPPGTGMVREEPSALRRPRGTSGKATRSHREPVDDAKDAKVCKGCPSREPGPAGSTAGSGRLLRSRKGEAPPPHSPADRKQPLQSPSQGEELGTDAAVVTRTSPPTADQSKPVTTSRRALRALNVKPTEELDSWDPGKSQGERSVAPKRKREDGSGTGPRSLRPRTRAQGTAEEKPPRKRQRTAPREQCAPPEPSGPQEGRRVLRAGTEPVDDLPGANGKTKKKGREEDGTSPNKGVSLRSSLRNKTRGAEPRRELLVSAEKGQRKRNEKKPVKASQEVETQNPEGGAQNSAPGDNVHERSVSPRPGRRRGQVPVLRGAEQQSQASGVETHGKAWVEKEGAPRSGSIRLRSRKVTVPPAGDALESPPKQRVTRSAKRPVEAADKENDHTSVKRMRARGRRGP